MSGNTTPQEMPEEKTCPDCGGEGEVEWETQGGNMVKTQCTACMGTGKVQA